MKRIIGSFFVSVFLHTPSLPADQDLSNWLGLWRIEQQSDAQNAVVYHLQISGDASALKLKLFSSEWLEVKVRSISKEPGQVTFYWEVGGKPFSMTLHPAQTGATGEWMLSHPQFPMKGAALARKVFSQANREPFEGTRRLQTAEGLVDLTGRLLKEAPLDSLEAFTAYWNKSFEPEYYPLVHDYLYGRQVLRKGLKGSQLKTVYEQLARASFKTHASEFSSLYTKVRRDLSQKFPDVLNKNALITLPPFSGAKSETKNFGGAIFTFVDVHSTKTLPREQLPYFIAHQVLITPLRLRHPAEGTLGLEIFKEGFRIYVSSQLGYSQNRSDAFLMTEEQMKEVDSNLAQYRSQIRNNVHSRSASLMRKYFADPPYAGRVVGYALIEKLSERFTPKELLDMQRPRLMEEIRAFLK
ncbi:MAG: hypothetical protein ACRD1R_17950 [Acidobacteriota bacterium]